MGRSSLHRGRENVVSWLFVGRGRTLVNLEERQVASISAVRRIFRRFASSSWMVLDGLVWVKRWFGRRENRVRERQTALPATVEPQRLVLHRRIAVHVIPQPPAPDQCKEVRRLVKTLKLPRVLKSYFFARSNINANPSSTLRVWIWG